MSNKESLITKALDWAYEQALNGIPGTPTAEDLARDYLTKKNNNAVKASKSLCNWQTGKSSAVGFATGLPGIMALPATLPADLTSVFYLQIRMVAAIAVMGGFDLKSDQVKTLVMGCLVGDAVWDIIKCAGVEFSKRASKELISRISVETIKKINSGLVKRLVTKGGSKGIINLGKAVPVVGGLVGAGFDAFSTAAVGKVARIMFIETS